MNKLPWWIPSFLLDPVPEFLLIFVLVLCALLYLRRGEYGG